MVENLPTRIQAELDKLKNFQKDYQKAVSTRQQLDGQLTENNMVKDELSRLNRDSTVYKLIGPVLVKQDLDEARSTVDKRIEYISGELKRQDGMIREIEKKMETHRTNFSKLQHQLQQAQVKAAAKA